MRFHTTIGFQEARKAQQQAWDAFIAEEDREEDSDASNEAFEAEFDATKNLLIYPAITPAEVSIKLDMVFKREVFAWSIKDDVIVALEADFKRLVRQPVSPPIDLALAIWRGEYLGCCLGGSNQEEENALCDKRSAAYRTLMAESCTTAGDFMVKAYVNLLEEVGHTLVGEAKSDLSGNLYDVSVEDLVNQIDESEVHQRSIYADLDTCDLGMNLLAYGLPTFSAELWMERADACGLQVSVMNAIDGHKGHVGVYLADDDELCPRLMRERERLRRLLAIDGKRYFEIAQEILENWPQLVFPRRAPEPLETEKAA